MKQFYKSSFLALGLILVLSGSAANVSGPARIDADKLAGLQLMGNSHTNISTSRGIPATLPSVAAVKSCDAAASDAADLKEEVLLEEDFSKWTEGSIVAPENMAGNPLFYENGNFNWDILPEWTAQPGWAGQGISQAGGVCALGSYTFGGFIQTPRMDYSGQTTFTMKAMVTPGSKVEDATVIVTFAKGDWENGTPVGTSYKIFAVPNDGTWYDLDFTYDNTYGGTDCFVQINTYGGLLVDDVKIVTLPTILAKPALKEATDYTKDGFTANWGDVGRATDYLITCWRNIFVSDVNAVFDESFEGVRHTGGTIDPTESGLPEGWTFEGITEVSENPEDLYDGSQALILNGTDQVIITPFTGSIMEEAKVMMRYINKPDEFYDKDGNPIYTDYPGYLRLFGFDGHAWNMLPVTMYFLGNEFREYDFTEFIAGKYYQLKIVTTSFSNYHDEDVRVAVDAFHVVTGPESEPEYVCQELPVESTSHVFTGLDEASDYYYNVIARNTEMGITSGKPDADMLAFGIAVPEVYDPTGVALDGSYTANWEKLVKAQEYKVDDWTVFTAPEDIDEYIVFEETFEPTLQFTDYSPAMPKAFSNMSLMYLDEYCDNPGWSGWMNGLVMGAVGGVGFPAARIGGQLNSPDLRLHNDGGKFHVILNAIGTRGSYLYVVRPDESGVAVALTGDYDNFEFDMTDGGDYDNLRFLTNDATDFFIQYLCITQNLKEGDKAYYYNGEAVTEDNELHFDSRMLPSADLTRAYTVRAVHKLYNNETWSQRSATMEVSRTTAIDNIAVSDEADAEVIAMKGAVRIIAGDNASVEVFNYSGALVASCIGGRTISLEPGFYLVKVDQDTTKVIVK